MSAVIAITNQKGGVGKTTTACALLAGLHQMGRRVLGVDLDPQGSLGFCLGLDIDNCATIYDVMKGSRPVREVIVPSSCGDILPSNILLSAAELEFNRPGREFLLKNCLDEGEYDYDYIIIDCGLKHELLTVNALAASDYCIIPVQAHFLASEGIPEVLELVKSVREKFNPRLQIAGILLTMYQSRPQLCRSVRESVGDIYGEAFHVFEQPIEYSIKVAECPAAGQSIFDYSPRNAAALSYRSLAEEVLELG